MMSYNGLKFITRLGYHNLCEINLKLLFRKKQKTQYEVVFQKFARATRYDPFTGYGRYYD